MIENRVLEGAYASGEPYNFSLIRVKVGESTFAHLPISDKRWYQRCFAIVRHYINKWHWILLPIYNTYCAKQAAKCGRQSCERDIHVPSPPFPLWNPESTGTESTSVAGLNPEHRSEADQYRRSDCSPATPAPLRALQGPDSYTQLSRTWVLLSLNLCLFLLLKHCLLTDCHFWNPQSNKLTFLIIYFQIWRDSGCLGQWGWVGLREKIRG